MIDPDERLIIPKWLKIVALGFFTVIGAAMAFAYFEPIQVLPRVRLAPGYALEAADGSTYSSESGRGVVTLYGFEPTDCGSECAEMEETMRQVRDRVGAEVDLAETDFRLITIALDPISSGDQLQAAAARTGADGEVWRWVGGDEVRIRTVVGDGFRRYFETAENGDITFDPGFVLVDGNGVIRGEYRYQTLADDTDKIVRHTEVLAEEIRYAKGATALAYEAAHLFLCYP